MLLSTVDEFDDIRPNSRKSFSEGCELQYPQALRPKMIQLEKEFLDNRGQYENEGSGINSPDSLGDEDPTVAEVSSSTCNDAQPIFISGDEIPGTSESPTPYPAEIESPETSSGRFPNFFCSVPNCRRGRVPIKGLAQFDCHMSTHKPRISVVCPQEGCERHFKTQAWLTRHLNEVHSNS
jgi:hypothetical protein